MLLIQNQTKLSTPGLLDYSLQHFLLVSGFSLALMVFQSGLLHLDLLVRK